MSKGYGAVASYTHVPTGERQQRIPHLAATDSSDVVIVGLKQGSSITHPTSRSDLPSSGHSDLSKTLDWILHKEGHSRTDYKGLAKRLPVELRQELEGLQVSPEEIVSRLSQSYKPRISVKSTGESNLDPLQFLAARLVDLALQSPTLTGRTVDAPFRSELVADVQKTFDSVAADQMQVYLTRSENPDARSAIFSHWKRALDATLERWSDRLDAAVYPTKIAGTFLKLCPVFKISQAKFQRKLQLVLRDIDCNAIQRDYLTASQKEAHLLEAVHSIQAGLHTVKTQCWQCARTLPQHELLVCGACNTASYCGHACQKRAWKAGHKAACSSLKCAQVQSVLDWNTVEQHHHQMMQQQQQMTEPKNENSAVIHILPGTTLRLADVVDYSILPLIVRVSAVLTAESLSMQQYYENLRRLASRDFWLFPSVFQVTEYERQFENDDDRDAIMTAVCVLLCIKDISLQSGTNLKEMSRQVLLEVFTMRGDDPPRNPGAAQQWVDRMTAVTASTFLNWYQAPCHISQTERDQVLHKRQQKAFVLKTLQKVHHKEAPPQLQSLT